MYRIRSASGTEAVYNSLEEFNVAVRRGAVSPEDEIFHMRANRWLDVKSHPHYRLAISGAGHNEVLPPRPTTPVAPASAPAPRPVAAAPAPQARVQAPVLERPAMKPQQTVLRPQLVSDVAPVAQAPAVQSPAPNPNAKSKDLAFIDLGTPSQRNATVIEARRAPPAPQPKAEPKRSVPETEVEFLVMDGGIESPVRTSQGHRTIPEDLDLLFDTPMPATKPGAAPSNGAAPQPPKPQLQITPRDPAVKKPEAAAPAPVEAPAPKPVAPKPAAAAVAAPIAPVEKPAEKPVVVAPPAPVAAAPVAAAPVVATPVAAPKPEPVVVAPEAVAPAAVRSGRHAAIPEDLTIPGAALLTMPEVVEAPVAAPSHAPAAGSKAPMIAAGVALLVVATGILAWKPWSNHGAAPDVALQPSTPVNASQSPAPSTTSAPVTGSGGPVTPASQPASGKTGAAATPTTVKQDSLTPKPADDEIIAAARPTFSANAAVPSGDLGLGSDIQPGVARVAAVAPSVLTERLETAEKLAQLELGTRLGGFRALFAPTRLASASGVAAARAAWTSGAESIRQYRAKIARMEQAYEDSVLSSQRSQRWSSEEMRAWAAHQSQAEPVETSQLADLMFSQVNEGLDILAALDGQYDIKGGSIAFKNPASGTRYTSIRTWVEQRTGVWSGTPESARPYSVSAILRALGDGLPAAQ